MKIYILIIMFFLIGAFFIVSEKNLSLSKQNDLQQFGKLYVNWLDQILGNVKYTTGYLVKLDWLPKNSSS